MNQKGFSLIEVIVALGVMTAGAFFMMKMNEDNQKTINNMFISQGIATDMANTTRRMSNVSACDNNFRNRNLSGGAAISSLRDENNNVFLSVGQEGGHGGARFRVTAIETSPKDASSFNLHITYQKIGSFVGSEVLRKTFAIPAQITGSTVEACQTSDSSVIAAAVEQSCYGGAIFDPVTKTCQVMMMAPGSCPVGQYVRGINYDASNHTFKISCRDMPTKNQDCPAGQFVRGFSLSGRPQCGGS